MVVNLPLIWKWSFLLCQHRVPTTPVLLPLLIIHRLPLLITHLLPLLTTHLLPLPTTRQLQLHITHLLQLLTTHLLQLLTTLVPQLHITPPLHRLMIAQLHTTPPLLMIAIQLIEKTLTPLQQLNLMPLPFLHTTLQQRKEIFTRAGTTVINLCTNHRSNA